MKAVRVHEFGGPAVLRLERVPDPASGPGQLVVRVRGAGVNPVDAYIRSGTYARRPALPYTPGTDAAGVVEATGPLADTLRPGDRVYVCGITGGAFSGAYAELVLCERSQVHPLPDRLSFAQGAAVGVPYATAYRALFQRAGALPGETVLVHGASGGVGTAAIQLAVAHGLTAIGTAGTDRGLELLREQGLQHALNHRQPDYLRQVLDATGGRGVDVVLEMLANVNLANDLSILAMHGRIVVVGNRGTIEIDPRMTMARDASIVGMALWNVAETDLARIYAAIGAGLANATLRPVVGRELPLGEAPRAHEAVMEPGAHGKIVLVP